MYRIVELVNTPILLLLLLLLLLLFIKYITINTVKKYIFIFFLLRVE
jgi:hypothetical protein